MMAPKDAKWQAGLADLLRAATRDPNATLILDDTLESPTDGYITLSAEFSGPSHPLVTVRASLSGVEQEAIVLHEAAHWRLGHVSNEAYRAAASADAAASLDAARAPFEREANEHALTTLLSEAAVLSQLGSPKAAVRDALLEGCCALGGAASDPPPSGAS